VEVQRLIDPVTHLGDVKEAYVSFTVHGLSSGTTDKWFLRNPSATRVAAALGVAALNQGLRFACTIPCTGSTPVV
jgi:hypothetical protein